MAHRLLRDQASACLLYGWRISAFQYWEYALAPHAWIKLTGICLHLNTHVGAEDSLGMIYLATFLGWRQWRLICGRELKLPQENQADYWLASQSSGIWVGYSARMGCMDLL